MAILKALAVRVRLLSMEQVATWWNGASPSAAARRRMNQLRDAGYVQASHVVAEPSLELRAPLVAWAPGQPDPDCLAVSHTLCTRWPDCPSSSTTVYRATQMTNNRLGGPARIKPLSDDQITHDLHVSSVFLHFLRTTPELADCWLGEDVLGLAGYRLKDPDAIVRHPDGSELVIEFGGRYGVERVRDFHDDCVKRGRAYQLW